MVTVERRWPHATLVCVAPGPSLTSADCDFVRGKAPVIAINDAVQVAPWADVLYSSDRTWWERHHTVPFTGLRFSVGSRVHAANAYRACAAIQVLENTGIVGLELAPTGLRTGQNSGHAAINLAVHLGAARIILLGYNMGCVGRATHFNGAPHGASQHYPLFRQHAATLVQPLKDAGVAVVNCTPRTQLTAFPLADLRDVLRQDAEAAA